MPGGAGRRGTPSRTQASATSGVDSSAKVLSMAFSSIRSRHRRGAVGAGRAANEVMISRRSGSDKPSANCGAADGA
ncbi:hypothetical protein GCM10009864_02580 [Streptomyces lunalinharesii]|uniref:Uncharacterized protein n=1 Tax=Streptomyces lunalinharesii TaxID=333384 RepID=A0ABN3R5U3_9ACTN